MVVVGEELEEGIEVSPSIFGMLIGFVQIHGLLIELKLIMAMATISWETVRSSLSTLVL